MRESSIQRVSYITTSAVAGTRAKAGHMNAYEEATKPWGSLPEADQRCFRAMARSQVRELDGTGAVTRPLMSMEGQSRLWEQRPQGGPAVSVSTVDEGQNAGDALSAAKLTRFEP